MLPNEQNTPLDLAVIVVSWNVRALILEAIRTVQADLKTSGLRYAIWVVENGSTDGSGEAIQAEFPEVTVFPSRINLGFGAANNIALRALGFRDKPTANPTGPRAVYLLNPDTITQPGATKDLYDTALTAPRAGVVGAQLAYADGSFQHSAFAFPGLVQLIIDLFPLDRLPPRLYGRLVNGRLNGRYSQRAYRSSRPFRIGHPLGATLMIRREAIEATGLFDEQFFMYVEEVDWCMRIRRAGFHNYCAPRVHVTHLSGQSTSQIRAQSLIHLWRSRFLFYQKHYSALHVGIMRALVRRGATTQIRRAETQLQPPQRDEIVEAWRTIRTL